MQAGRLKTEEEEEKEEEGRGEWNWIPGVLSRKDHPTGRCSCCGQVSSSSSDAALISNWSVPAPSSAATKRGLKSHPSASLQVRSHVDSSRDPYRFHARSLPNDHHYYRIKIASFKPQHFLGAFRYAFYKRIAINIWMVLFETHFTIAHRGSVKIVWMPLPAGHYHHRTEMIRLISMFIARCRFLLGFSVIVLGSTGY